MIDAKLLLEKYKQGKCTHEEIDLLHSWFHELNLDEPSILEESDLKEALQHVPGTDELRSLDTFIWRKIILAASILIFIAISALWILKKDNRIEYFDKLPTDAVVLILEDGRKINLKDIDNGIIKDDVGFQVQKTSSGRIQYTFDKIDNKLTNKITYHTIQTPIGEIFEIILSDDTKVTLNAQSTLRFPANFSNTKSRQVELYGEAFFDVTQLFADSSKTKHKPFIIKSKNQHVAVLGTSFNIHAYPNEPLLKTTLVNGKVRVSIDHLNKSIDLTTPGEQALWSNNNFQKRAVPLTNELAWQDGKIFFEDQDIYSIMNSIARYYPIQVEYKDNFRNAKFGGVISRGKSLEEILKLVEETGEINFEITPATNNINERRVTVMK